MFVLTVQEIKPEGRKEKKACFAYIAKGSGFCSRLKRALLNINLGSPKHQAACWSEESGVVWELGDQLRVCG